MFKLRMSRADRRRWRSAASLAELGELTAQWLEGRIESRAGYAPGFGPDAETTEYPRLVEALAACNRRGFVTECSQPGLVEVGTDGNWWHQRAAVGGFTNDPAVLDTLRTVAKQHGLLIIEHRPVSTGGRTGPQGIVATERGGRPWTTFGNGLTVRDIRRIWRGAGRDAVAETEQAWQVTLADPRFGCHSSLFDVLLVAFADVPVCVRCYCTEANPCPGDCSWAPKTDTGDLCDACAAECAGEN
ncbi:DUF6919 domain-containing protein [Kitasatospora kifunensis]|uniref:DUF6919 domain-containing protein n=1 Tax=Kitasatospora kifunensis TaxID=58351 RepID=A0A7W7RC22_KITKI|nr:hypothetical protein [Kitasatospora kifunensis]MBB4929154.1 hypothetical protein [Kitasatospora kifunensis]